MSCDNAIIITSQEIDELKNQYLVPLVGVLGITTIFRREKTMNYIDKIMSIIVLLVAVWCYVLMVYSIF